MMRVRWSAAADRDLEVLRAYYDEADKDTAQRMVDRLVLATDWLLDWPYAGPEIAASGWRKWAPRRTGHVLIYRLVAGNLESGRVRGERENWMDDF